MRDERSIYHVPELFVVLKFLIYHRIQHCPAFTHSEASKFGEDVRHGHIVLLTNPLDVFHDLLDHVLVIVLKGERCFNWEAAPDINRVENVADLSHLAILENEAAEFTPI